MAHEFDFGDEVAVGEHSFHRSDRSVALIDHLYHIAMTSPDEEKSLTACIACLNWLEGPPKPMRRRA